MDLAKNKTLEGDRKMLKGIAVSEGIAIGKAFCVQPVENKKEYVKPESREAEHARFLDALESFLSSTRKSAADMAEKGMEEESGILLSHVEMINDPFVLSKVEEELDKGVSAEEAVDTTLQFFADMFEATGDELTMQRAADIRDINRSICGILSGTESVDISALPDGTILVINELTPSMAVEIDTDKIAGIITQTGGYTSHSAILARALRVPAVMGVSDAIDVIDDGSEVIVDGTRGMIDTAPDIQAKKACMAQMEEIGKRRKLAETFRGKSSLTASGELKEIVANIGNVADAEAAKKEDAEGIGLFRTEFLYMDRECAPNEEEQVAAYSIVSEIFAPSPVIIRTLDIGGDKNIPYINIDHEDNPFMGFRAVRYCLENRDLFKTQLRALLRANQKGNIKIMIPMVTNVTEVIDVKALIAECCCELRDEGKDYNEQIKLGIMIETPAAVVTADILAQEVDFFSIGTNDLTGYMMSADRGNSKVAYLYDTYQPAVLRMIKSVCSAAHEARIPVGMCGEAAADAALIPCLISFGLDEFSVGAENVLDVRKTISQWSYDEAKDIAENALKLKTSEDVREYLYANKR